MSGTCDVVTLCFLYCAAQYDTPLRRKEEWRVPNHHVSCEASPNALDKTWMMKTRHVDCPRSAIIVFRFSTFNFGEVSHEASYADSRTLCGLACAPRTSLAPLMRHAQRSRPTKIGTIRVG